MPVSFSALATAWPERFMYVCGRTNHTPRGSARPTSDCHRFFWIGASNRRASSRTHAKPRLWRVSAYSDSGLPSPTISRSSSFLSSMHAQLGPRRAPQTCQRNIGEPPHLLGLRRRGVIPPEQMQEAVHEKHGELRLLVVSPHRGLFDHARPRDRDVPDMRTIALERQHVGHVVFAGKGAVEAPHLLVVGDAHRERRF